MLRILSVALLAAVLVPDRADAVRGKRRRGCCCAGRVPVWRGRPCDRQTGPANPAGAEAGATQNLFDGKTLAGWNIADKFSFANHGDVRVRNGRIELQAGSPATGIVWTGQPPRNDYQLSLEAMRTDGSDFFCGLTFPVGEEYCSLILGGWGGELVGLSNVDAMSANENETTAYEPFQQNRWYRVRLRVATGRIEVWIDQRQVIQLETAGRRFDVWWEQEPVRPLGIATWHTAAALRNIRLQRLASP
ncbi:MAG: DUF1080 domain-containing protein [Planctomycetales bacterium]|nr:DUF1080 domain-containing protein [Planctomycetales bacterium]